jgi:hypothetical protein
MSVERIARVVVELGESTMTVTLPVRAGRVHVRDRAGLRSGLRRGGLDGYRRLIGPERERDHPVRVGRPDGL